ncbi:MAG: aldolase catalytic domain-containing protein [Ruminiclostridium sp.]|nr:aldolase catalytic domain-containing protein [Ruminiclostridium sp.]
MDNISILDCTLRDGGYCNKWRFGHSNIETIISGLETSGIDIIECGYITQKISSYDEDVTQYRTFADLEELIKDKKNNAMYVAMINFGEFSPEDIPDNKSGLIDGIRLAFHKKNAAAALDMCRILKEKGYAVFVQPMLTLSYSDSEFIELIKSINSVKPYAAYIVDSFGSMNANDLMRLFYLADNNLCDEIKLGFHSHNNLQLAYSNAQTLISMPTERKLIIDSSIMGMGRGAGNLNSELIIQRFGDRYYIVPMLKIIDEILGNFYKQNYWGYSLANYLSATYNLHPNYANYLDDKDTLSFENMNDIFSLMSDEKRFEFDKGYIERIYYDFMERRNSDSFNIDKVTELIAGKNVLVIAPGKSIDDHSDEIAQLAASPDMVSFSVNFYCPFCESDFIFLGNIKREREIKEHCKNSNSKLVAVSNVSITSPFAKLPYADLINENEAVSDNSCLMLLKFLAGAGVKKIFIAGMDGYSYNREENYSRYQTGFIKRSKDIDAINKGLSDIVGKLSKKADISFITPTLVK